MRIWETKASEISETEKLDVIINSFMGKWYRKEEKRQKSMPDYDSFNCCKNCFGVIENFSRNTL